jgi:hypothetical protein
MLGKIKSNKSLLSCGCSRLWIIELLEGSVEDGIRCVRCNITRLDLGITLTKKNIFFIGVDS